MRIFSIFLLLVLAACAGPQKQELAAPLTPMPAAPALIDPGDELLAAAVQDYLKTSGVPLLSRYDFTRADLDGDGRREGLVMMKSPFHTWCSQHGCRMIVFKASNTAFTPMSTIGPVRGPLLISDRETNGWKDLVIRISGRTDEQTRNVVLRFDGGSYPAQPDTQPMLYAQNTTYGLPGRRIFP